ncbi:rhomboid family intramembrane serine protease [Kushneria marisflavi]|uniref:Rhomboid family intramembrane serine protease n=1 Tax=Kushneria marisflavi TaxID=157779 RepID=A0A240ULT3_9GAMM|nr:rhomboid family intramembrane serine protease [Kushneria marisflavi]ART61980.1 rhomboid family intramembrane serine protease [Kushneria marisflavi]RKD87032.1 GlpG protein [Kushneria marisflavi]
MPQALRFPLDADIEGLRHALWKHRIGHHYSRDQNGQVLWLIEDVQLEKARELIDKWHKGEAMTLDGQDAPVARAGSIMGALRLAPVTTVVIVMCLAVFAWQSIDNIQALTALAIAPIAIEGKQLYASTLGYALSQAEVWRLFSPAFLHFSLMHLIFNLLWLWYFGRQVEALQGRWRLLALLISGMLVSNLAQYATGTVLFGGMSGVVYALVGFVWLYSRLVPDSGFQFPPMLMVFMVGWLVLCMTPAANWLGFGNVANEAHLGGLLLGLAAGLLGSRFHPRRAVPVPKDRHKDIDG